MQVSPCSELERMNGSWSIGWNAAWPTAYCSYCSALARTCVTHSTCVCAKTSSTSAAAARAEYRLATASESTSSEYWFTYSWRLRVFALQRRWLSHGSTSPNFRRNTSPVTSSGFRKRGPKDEQHRAVLAMAVRRDHMWKIWAVM